MIPRFIILHHSFTKDRKVEDWKSIRTYHTSWRYNGNIITQEKARQMKGQGIKGVEAPWKDIGYHYGIEFVNDKFVIQKGREENVPGAHCYQNGMNAQSLGICFIGNFDLAPPPELMWRLGISLVCDLCMRYEIPVQDIYMHHQFANYKTCPGLKFDIERFRDDTLKFKIH